MRSQPRLKKGHREPLWACMDPRLKAAVRRDAIRWDCSMSWVAITALAAFYDVDVVKPFEAKRKPLLRRVK